MITQDLNAFKRRKVISFSNMIPGGFRDLCFAQENSVVLFLITLNPFVTSACIEEECDGLMIILDS